MWLRVESFKLIKGVVFWPRTQNLGSMVWDVLRRRSRYGGLKIRFPIPSDLKPVRAECK